MIKFMDFTFRYHGKDHDTLSNIHFKIEKGEMIVIAGPSGCGKSTLALALAGFLFQQDFGSVMGSIEFEGKDIARIPLFEMADKVGLVQQNPENQFCTLTVIDELAFGLENQCLPISEIHQRIKWALEVVDGQNLEYQDISSLSGGEKQKIAIASILAAKPDVLILDEPTSNLDPQASLKLFEVISNLSKLSGLTIIIIEHKFKQLLPYNPRLIIMNQGKIKEQITLKTYLSSKHPQKTQQISERECKYESSKVIRVNDLSIAYANREVLSYIDLTIKEGEFISLMGKNGAGKSTLLLSLMGLIQPAHGNITLLGCDLKTQSVSETAKKVGIVFQNPDHQIFTNTVWHEVSFAPHNFGLPSSQYEAETQRLLDACGLTSLKDIHPNKLSYGEKRRLNLVSILSYNPKVILLDEILIGQDEDNAYFLLNLLKEHAQCGGVIIMAHHQPDWVSAFSTRTLFLDEGRLTLDCPQALTESRLLELNQPYFLADAVSLESA
ncbi:MAG: ABC transporter ATP-binding protein [Chloroflexota bacterium]